MPNLMKIKVKVETGETVNVVDDNDHDAPDAGQPVIDPQRVEQLCRGLGLMGYQCVGVVLNRHASPG